MKKILFVAVLLICVHGYSQLGWESYTGQPTQTLYGSAAGAGLGYFLAPAISKGPDAQWLGALTGLAAGGLVGNYMAGDSNTHQKLMNNNNNSNTYKPRLAKTVGMGTRTGKNSVQSPYSDFAVNYNDYTSGQVVTDPITGQLFRIP